MSQPASVALSTAAGIGERTGAGSVSARHLDATSGRSAGAGLRGSVLGANRVAPHAGTGCGGGTIPWTASGGPLRLSFPRWSGFESARQRRPGAATHGVGGLRDYHGGPSRADRLSPGGGRKRSCLDVLLTGSFSSGFGRTLPEAGDHRRLDGLARRPGVGLSATSPAVVLG